MRNTKVFYPNCYNWFLSFITHAPCTRVATGQLYKARDEERKSADMWAEHNRTLDLAEQQQWARCPKCAHIVSIIVITCFPQTWVINAIT